MEFQDDFADAPKIKKKVKQQSNQQNDINQKSAIQQAMNQYTKNHIISFDVRQELRTTNLRDFHNQIKSQLINIYCQKLLNLINSRNRNLLSVLDLGCGKGGDLKKWAHNNIGNYYGIDISNSHLLEAQNRLKDLKNIKKFQHKKFIANFDQKSGSHPNLFDNSQFYFDIVSSQFVLHYMFDSEQSVKNLLHNISCKLLKDGFFICIVPDSNVIVKRLREHSVIKDENYIIQNDFYSIQFNQMKFPKSNPYGIKYGFYLEDAIGKKQILDDQNFQITYTEEYLIVQKNFIELAKQYNLNLIRDQNLIDFYNQEKHERLQQCFQSVDKKQLEISHLYKVYVFQKNDGVDINSINRDWRKYTVQQNQDEIVFN